MLLFSLFIRGCLTLLLLQLLLLLLLLHALAAVLFGCIHQINIPDHPECPENTSAFKSLGARAGVTVGSTTIKLE